MKTVNNKTILFVEDDSFLLAEMTKYFRSRGNLVYAAETLDAAKELLRQFPLLDMIILDVVLPDGTGLDLLKDVRNLPPVIILSDLGREDNILEGFEVGVTDYVVKPCSMKMLETRIVLRLLPTSEAQISVGNFAIDSFNRTVHYRSIEVKLTASEFNILFFLVSHRGNFFTTDEIYESIWNAPSLNTTTIKRHLSSLRQKMKDVAPETDFIVTKFGHGYAFSALSGEVQ